MVGTALDLVLLEGTFAVCRLAADEAVPDWAQQGSVSSVTRTTRELSIVCEQDVVPPEVQSDTGWRCLMVEGPLAFTEVGILASLTAPLAASGISVFVISTYDTDFLLIKEAS
ncbi:MAG: ACT domain-containing protein, partial [Thermoanaerobaculia bacterium]